jgi:hypothetical protein
METIQLVIGDASYATALKEMLVRDGSWEVFCAEVPDLGRPGVIMLDAAALERLPSRVTNPERIVLIAQNDPQPLSRAWAAGIVSVVFDDDPLSTAMLAIMAARLRVTNDVRRESSSHPPSSTGLNSASRSHKESQDTPGRIKPAPGR